MIPTEGTTYAGQQHTQRKGAAEQLVPGIWEAARRAPAGGRHPARRISEARPTLAVMPIEEPMRNGVVQAGRKDRRSLADGFGAGPGGHGG
jgi:hypothetical protein